MEFAHAALAFPVVGVAEVLEYGGVFVDVREGGVGDVSAVQWQEAAGVNVTDVVDKREA